MSTENPDVFDELADDILVEEMGNGHADPLTGRPAIRIGAEMTPMVDEAESAIMALPHGPHLYQRARLLCVVAHSAPTPTWLNRPPDAPTIATVEQPHVSEIAGRAAQWLKYDKRAKSWDATLPPLRTIATLCARVNWRFPPLESIVTAPTLRRDGRLITQPGYDADSGLYLDTQGVTFPQLPDQLGLDDAQMAVARLQAAFCDFPFAEPAGLSAVLAAIFSLAARHAITGCVPLFAVRSTTRGAGKGLLVDAIAVIGTGRPAPRWPQVQDADEERKRLLTIALSGDACTHIDNVTLPLGSAAFDSALTSNTIKDRILGINKSVEAPLLSVFFASGNNMVFRGDMARRVIPIDLAPEQERPEERNDFENTPLLSWITDRRPSLIMDAILVLKAYIDAGRPLTPHVLQFGSFEPWSDFVRHALLWVGEPDPCEGRKNIEAESDTAYESLARFLECWDDCFHRQEITLSMAIQDIGIKMVEIPNAVNPANEWNHLFSALGAFDSRFDGKRLNADRIGYGIRKIEGRVIEKRRFKRAGTTHGTARWQLQQM